MSKYLKSSGSKDRDERNTTRDSGSDETRFKNFLLKYSEAITDITKWEKDGDFFALMERFSGSIAFTGLDVEVIKRTVFKRAMKAGIAEKTIIEDLLLMAIIMNVRGTKIAKMLPKMNDSGVELVNKMKVRYDLKDNIRGGGSDTLTLSRIQVAFPENACLAAHHVGVRFKIPEFDGLSKSILVSSFASCIPLVEEDMETQKKADLYVLQAIHLIGSFAVSKIFSVGLKRQTPLESSVFQDNALISTSVKQDDRIKLQKRLGFFVEEDSDDLFISEERMKIMTNILLNASKITGFKEEELYSVTILHEVIGAAVKMASSDK